MFDKASAIKISEFEHHMFKNACVLALEDGKDAPTTSSRKHAARASSCVKDTDIKMFIGKYIKSLCVISSRYAKFTFFVAKQSSRRAL